MDFLKAEIARKRQKLHESGVVDAERSFFKRSDLAAKQTQEYWEKYKQKHDIVEPDVEGDDLNAEKTLDELESKHKTRMLSRREVVRRLRERGQPVRVFGESEKDAARRLRRAEYETPDLKPGWRNDFQDALEQADQDYLKAVIEGDASSKAGTSGAQGKHDVKTEEKLQDFDNIIKAANEELGSGVIGAKRECQIIYDCFNFLLQKWGFNLNARSEDEKRSNDGKQASAKYYQCTEYIKPLMDSLRDSSVATDIRTHLVKIVKGLVTRNYIVANAAYVQLAIGNAPWPVGTSRTGIHLRPGQNRSAAANVAHVLNDETQRKYIQGGIKRLMTRCQEYYPTDPSRSLNFVKAKVDGEP